MVTRSSSKQVTFNRPFILSGFDTIQAAGTYTVSTEEELLADMSFAAWKRTGTVMQLTRGASTEHVTIDPEELHEALMRDGAQNESAMPSSASPHPRHKQARLAARALQFLGGKNRH